MSGKNLRRSSLQFLIVGFGSAAVLVASFGCAQKAATSSGVPDSMEVQAVVSGLFTASFALGNFCGPTISGGL